MKGLRIGAVVVAAQLALVIVYFVVQMRRVAPDAGDGALRVAPPESIDIAAPPLVFRRANGSTVALLASRRPAVIHFWATRCPPCREELPTFLAMQVPDGVDVFAVSLDTDRAAVERFVAASRRPRLVFGRAADVTSTLGDRSLPVTYVMDANGRLRWRFIGARDWADPRVVRSLALGAVSRE